MNRIEELYMALSSNKEITSLLADGKEGIRADLTSYSGRYPVLCYQVISDVPALFADDSERAHRTTVQISILTRDGVDGKMTAYVVQTLTALGWMRESTNRITSGKVRITAIRFVMTEDE